MATPSIEVVGLQGVLYSLERVEGGLDAALLDDRVTGVMLADANRRVPVRTGALRSSGRVEAGAVIYGSAAVPYAVPVHWGSAIRNIAPQPWLKQARDDRAAQERTAAVAAEELQKLINREA